MIFNLNLEYGASTIYTIHCYKFKLYFKYISTSSATGTRLVLTLLN